MNDRQLVVAVLQELSNLDARIDAMRRRVSRAHRHKKELARVLRAFEDHRDQKRASIAQLVSKLDSSARIN